MTGYFLGVDTGATKSHALICDAQGTAVGAGFGGPGNHESIGKAGFRTVLVDITRQALASAGIARADLTAAGYGIAGYDWSEDLPMMREVIGSLDFAVPYGLMNDAGPGLLAASSNGWGVSIAAGTGSNGRGRDAQGREGRMTGNGRTFGESGGGGELVGRAIQAIARAWSQRGPQTRLSDLFVAAYGAKDVEDLLAGIARGRYHIRAAHAPLVFQAADEGDDAARNAIRRLGHGLGDMACGIIRQLGIEDLAFDVVLSGSLYKGSPLILEAMREVVCQLAPQARFVTLTAPPVTGAVMLAMEQVGLDYRPLRQRIIQTGEPLLAAQSPD